MSIFTNAVCIVLSASQRNILLFAQHSSPLLIPRLFSVALASRFVSVNLACKITPICVLKHDAIKGKEDNDCVGNDCSKQDI